MRFNDHWNTDLRKRVLDSLNTLSSLVLLCHKNKRGCVLNFYQKIKSQTSFFDITKPRRIEHLQNQEPFSSDPYSRTILMFEIKIAQYFQSFFVPQLEILWPTLFYWVAVPVEGISWQRNCSCTYLRIPNGTWNVLSAALGQIGFFFLNCPKTASDICKASLLFTGENLLKKIVCVRITRLYFST